MIETKENSVETAENKRSHHKQNVIFETSHVFPGGEKLVITLQSPTNDKKATNKKK